MKKQFNFCEISAKCDLAAKADLEQIENGVQIIHLVLSWDVDTARKSDDVLQVRATYPLTGCRFRWNPLAGTDRRLRAVWMKAVHFSNTTCSAPVVCNYNGNDNNSITFAASELRKKITVNCGPDEAGHMVLQLQLPLAQFNSADDYHLDIYIDRRPKPYFAVLDDVRRWWESTCLIKPMPVPDCGRQPAYSTWYSYHQKLTQTELEEECRKAKALGLDTVILDDGWQTDDCGGGYGYCGDWEVATSKFPNMKQHVETIHKLGMKYMVWFSVPFLGFFSKHYAEYKAYSLLSIPGMNCDVLDPRYPAVRAFLKDTYVSFVNAYQVDGLKLDFVDRLVAPDGDQPKEGMDFDCVQDATVAMLTEIMEALRAQNPDILIEFRQSYIGPNIRRFGNLLRVADCPNDGFCNRIGMTDIRLLAGKSAVHSDMLIWNTGETVEQAALQMLDCLFGTLQYSLKIEDLPLEHIEMSKFWIGFMKTHISLLQTECFEPKEPQNLYPVITVQDKNDVLTAVYERQKIATFIPCTGRFYLINATTEPVMYLKTDTAIQKTCCIRNCMGQVIEKKQLRLEPGVHSFAVPSAGMLELYTD